MWKRIQITKSSENEKVQYTKLKKYTNDKKHPKIKNTVYECKNVYEWQKVCENEKVQYVNVKKYLNDKKYIRLKKYSIIM